MGIASPSILRLAMLASFASATLQAAATHGYQTMVRLAADGLQESALEADSWSDLFRQRRPNLRCIT